MQLASGNVPVQYRELPGGFRGTDETVKVMARLAMGKYGARSAKIRAAALNIIRSAGIREKDYEAEAQALGRWVRDNIRYLKDVYGQETVSHPEETLFNTRAGDCDDQSVLLAALAGSVGIPTRFKVIGVTPHQYSHVYLQARPAKRWITMDPIMSDKPIGWEVPIGKRAIEKAYPVNGPGGFAPGQGVNGMSGLGYIADPRVVSHLEEPTLPLSAGTGRQPPKMKGRPNYVVMPSNLDTDTPVDPIMAFHPNQNVPPQYPTQVAQRVDPQSQVLTNRGVARAPQQPEVDPTEAQALDGRYETWSPDEIAGMGAGPQDSAVPPYMQSKTVLQRPEGVDAQFGRASMVVDPQKGDKVEYYGHFSMAEKPPIRPYHEVSGYEPAGTTMPGMGMFGEMAGPGLGADATGNQPQQAVAIAQGAPSAPPKSKAGLVGLVALGALAVYAATRKR